MLVGERMSRPVISVSPDAPIHDVLVMFKKEHIRRAPVMKDGKLVGSRLIGHLLRHLLVLGATEGPRGLLAGLELLIHLHPADEVH